MNDSDPLESCVGFEWDENNLDKNWQMHGVPFWECEEIFLNEPLVVRKDSVHSDREQRYYVLGQSDSGRLLFVVFAVRRNLIRVISARDMTGKEKKVYKRYEKEDSGI